MMCLFRGKNSEVEYLRALVKDLMTQNLLLINKHSDFLNVKRAEKDINSFEMPSTPYNHQPMTEEEKIQRRMAEEELFAVMSHGKTTFPEGNI